MQQPSLSSHNQQLLLPQLLHSSHGLRRMRPGWSQGQRSKALQSGLCLSRQCAEVLLSLAAEASHPLSLPDTPHKAPGSAHKLL